MTDTSTPSDFAVEYQRRLRAVLAARSGIYIPDDAVARVTVEAYVDGTDTMGYSASAEVEIEARTPDGCVLTRHTDEGYRVSDDGTYTTAWARLMRDLFAVPEVSA